MAGSSGISDATLQAHILETLWRVSSGYKLNLPCLISSPLLKLLMFISCEP